MTGPLLALLLPVGALAANVPAVYCVDYEVEYTDGATGDYLTGGTVPAYGALLRFIPDVGGQFGYYLDEDGDPNPGCKTIIIDDLPLYEVQLILTAEIEGNTLETRNAAGQQLGLQLATGHTPVGATTYDNGDWSPVVHPAVQIMAAASWALKRRHGAVTGETLTLVSDDTCPAGNSCYSSSAEEVRIRDGDDVFKYLIVHEFGHMLADASNGWLGTAKDFGASMNSCAPAGTPQAAHHFPSKEFNSSAATEGFADFYAAVAFNTIEAGADCAWEMAWAGSDGIDWNLNDIAGEQEDVTIFSCEGAVEWWDGLQWLQVCDEADFFSDFCAGSGATGNRGTEFDWMRMLWELATDQGVTIPTLFSIWDEADPDDWNATGS